VARPAPVVDAPAPAAAQPPTTAAWLAQSPSRAVLIGGASCVACLALGLLIGASSGDPPAEVARPAAPIAATPPAAPAPMPSLPAPARQVVAPAPARPGAARTPVVQQLRLDPAPTVPAAPADAGVYVPRYSSPQFLDRTRQQQLAPAPADERRRGEGP
jgi:hypothetical protein